MYSKKRIGIMGAGGIGGVVGGLLSRAGHDVTLIDTWTEHISQIKNSGLLVSTSESLYKCKPEAINLNELQQIKEKFDLVIISVKSYDTDWATMAIKRYVKEEGFYIDFQNGINDPTVAKIVGEDKTLGCIITISAAIYEPGIVMRTDNRKDVCFKVGEFNRSKSERLIDFVQIMQSVGKSDYTLDLLGERWSKLMINCMANPLAGLTGWGTSKVRTETITQNIAIQIAAEVVKVAKSSGFKMGKIMGMEPEDFIDGANGKKLEEIKSQFLEAANLAGSLSRPSFGQDVLKKRRTEIDYLTGYVSKIGKSNRVPTPFCNKITEIVNNLGVGFDPSPDHLKDLERMLT